ncbi:hypothetical protein E3N88_00163 [Mikania micrantha]|uniref:CCHC-type domain-containing protein n=1 Tax=Mikania micrantha TaxID=192012 RepID=A0A5N6PYQ5_9ASTR|nr:hypothetical protein E3N88_00163 [Mikania micrantha]
MQSVEWTSSWIFFCSLSTNFGQDVIGDVVTCSPSETVNLENRVAKRMNMEIQDSQLVFYLLHYTFIAIALYITYLLIFYYRGLKLYVTLWDGYAEQMSAYLSNNPDENSVIIIIQFGKLKFSRDKLCLSNSYDVTKLYINSQIEEINVFRKSLRESSVATDSSCVRRSIVSSMLHSMHYDFLECNDFITIADIHGILEVKSIVILGTIKCVSKDVPWYYLGCTKCNKKVEPTFLITSVDDASEELEQKEIYECSNPKLTDDVKIITELEKKLLIDQDSTSFTGENVTPASYSEKTTRNNPVINKKTLMASSSNSELKRKLEDIYDVEDKLPISASKGLFSMEDDVANCNDTLLIPKLEKTLLSKAETNHKCWQGAVIKSKQQEPFLMKCAFLFLAPKSRGRGRGKHFNKGENTFGRGMGRGNKDKNKFRCYDCGDFGHFANSCTKWKNKEKEKPEASNLIYDEEPTLL